MSQCPYALYFQPRAQVATELLLELNEDVNGDYVEEVSVFLNENV